MANIYHILKQSDWESAVAAGFYAPKSLEHEGFIHCSRSWQVPDVANALFSGQAGLVLLCIDTERVEAGIRNEDCFNSGETFPHIYGVLQVDAVTRTFDFPPDEDGTFLLPDGVS